MAAATEALPADIATGFADPVQDAQMVFRAVLVAMSHPGQMQRLRALPAPPAPLSPTAAAVALTLVDQDVSVWLSPYLATRDVRDFLVFHTGTRIVDDASKAVFVLCAGPEEIPPLATLAQGTAEYPDRSATVTVAVRAGDAVTEHVVLSGPGVEQPSTIGLQGFDRSLWHRLQANHAAYPLGIDLIVCGVDGVVALPRSTAIEVN